MPRRHSDQTRADALADVPTLGISGVAKKHGLGKATISRWAEEAGIGTVPNEQTQAATEAARLRREATREVLKGQLLDKARDMLTRMDEEHVDYRGKDSDRVTWDKAPSGACQQYATAAAILIDKSQLLEGKATTRTEHVDPTDAELRELLAEMARP